MRICVISSQFFGFGKIGGFGNMARKLALSLSENGHDVAVVVPRKKGQDRIEHIDNFQVIGLSPTEFLNREVFREIDADIYHSQNPTLSTYTALRAEPDKKHVITFRDPRSASDWLIEMTSVTWRRLIPKVVSALFESGFFISYAVKKADVVGVPAKYLQGKVQTLFGRKDVIFLPNIEKMPPEPPIKAQTPTVCFVGRLDKIKNPERVFRLARNFPQVQFIVAGTAHDDQRQRKLTRVGAQIENLKMMGYIDKFSSDALDEIYAPSWILVNTSLKEALPATFIEGAAQRCAILSGVNPDNFTSDFGYWCQQDDYEFGLEYLLQNDLWKQKGQAAYDYVKGIYDEEIALSKHTEIYRALLEGTWRK